MTLTYQGFTVVMLIYGSVFLSGICYRLRVFWCAAARMSELQLEQRTNIKFLLDFKLSPCFESIMYSFGCFPGV